MNGKIYKSMECEGYVAQRHKCLSFPAHAGRAEFIEDGDLDSIPDIRIAFSSIKPLPEGRLWVQYYDGEVRIFDVYEYMEKNDLTSVYSDLYDESFFSKVKTELGVPSWNRYIDFDPIAVYEQSKPIKFASKSSKIQAVSMPRISEFGIIPGVTLYLYRKDHNPPHINAISRNGSSNFTFDGSLVPGSINSLSPREVRSVRKFIRRNKAKIQELYTKFINKEFFEQIE
jgi:hypothetical protein